MQAIIAMEVKEGIWRCATAPLRGSPLRIYDDCFGSDLLLPTRNELVGIVYDVLAAHPEFWHDEGAVVILDQVSFKRRRLRTRKRAEVDREVTQDAMARARHIYAWLPEVSDKLSGTAITSLWYFMSPLPRPMEQQQVELDPERPDLTGTLEHPRAKTDLHVLPSRPGPQRECRCGPRKAAAVCFSTAIA